MYGAAAFEAVYNLVTGVEAEPYFLVFQEDKLFLGTAGRCGADEQTD
jgi:hypothetical protein